MRIRVSLSRFLFGCIAVGLTIGLSGSFYLHLQSVKKQESDAILELWNLGCSISFDTTNKSFVSPEDNDRGNIDLGQKHAYGISVPAGFVTVDLEWFKLFKDKINMLPNLKLVFTNWAFTSEMTEELKKEFPSVSFRFEPSDR